MPWGAAIAAGGALLGGAMGSKSSKSAQNAANNAQKEQMMYQQLFNRQNQEWAQGQNLANAGTAQDMTRENYDWANQQNRANQEWAQQLNQQAIQEQIGQNRLSGTNAMGTSMGFDENGNYTQTLGAGDQQLMDTLRGKSNDIMQGMGGGFDVNGDVMNAYKAVNQPLVDLQRNKENARLAAMGLGTGSGTAWGTAQDALNRNQVNSDQNAILQGFNADQALRTSNRADLGAMGGVRSGIQAGTATPDYWKAGIANVSAPTTSGWQSTIGQAGAGSNPSAQDPMAALNYGNAAGQATANQWAQLGQLGGEAYNKYANTGTAGATKDVQGMLNNPNLF